MGRRGARAFRRLGPFERQMPNVARCINLDQRFEYGTHHCQLPGTVAAIPDRASERILDPRHARCANRCGQIGNIGKSNCGYLCCLNLALNQSNGPVADWSGGEQHDDIDLVLAQMLDDRRHGFVEEGIGL